MLTRNYGAQTARIEADFRNRLVLREIRELCDTLTCRLGRFARAVAGGICCFVGLALILTLWLMPLGLLLAFLGTALMRAGDATSDNAHR